MNQMVNQGMSIIMISSELPEILSMSDRIYVISEGKVTGEVIASEADQEIVMRYATM
jgi:ABC-type sugar transport system ATPase subunit